MYQVRIPRQTLINVYVANYAFYSLTVFFYIIYITMHANVEYYWYNYWFQSNAYYHNIVYSPSATAQAELFINFPRASACSGVVF